MRLTELQARADAKGLITWDVSVDSTICRAHQRAAGAVKRGIFRRSRPAALRRCGIRCTIPEKKNQVRTRKKLGSSEGRPLTFDKADYRERHAVECGINRLKRHRAVATGYD